MFCYLFILLLLQKLGCVHCAVTLFQPPAIAAMLGSSVNLNCSMQLNGVKLDRVNLYWLVPDVNNKVKEYLVPRPKKVSARSSNSRLIYPEFTNDLSLTIDNVQLPYTDTYICETSLLIGTRNARATGDGTYLLVYEEFSTFMNHTDLFCKVKLQTYQNVDLLWESQDQDYISTPPIVDPASDNSYWISRVLTYDPHRCRQNTTITCRLQYKGQSLVESSIEVACTGRFFLLFYVVVDAFHHTPCCLSESKYHVTMYRYRENIVSFTFHT
ncbi:uncharacterized protein LOC130294051 isoform X2 [Hyla sarda]|uniref:uncharacterized protein LOC130294051 isoform X2 n=1 Tax=Hyla sarda TaxID=327740 RepID=UPI0024C28645|nr:uncharacterized protein LOC130294051 isoform X2 [Hyla sarda]